MAAIAEKTGGSVRALQISYLFFEGGYSWICVAAIDVALRLALRHFQPLVDIVVAERGTQGYRDLR
jgi:hypothetical protein